MEARFKRVVLYSRCSTIEQQPEAQLLQLRQFAILRGWKIVEEIIDHGYSGGTDRRPGLSRLLGLVRRRDVDVVCVVKLDRIFRSLQHLVSLLNELQQLSVEFVSVHDQIDLTTAQGKLHFQILGAFGEFEKNLIRERTIIGMEYARSIGKKIGRPRVNKDAQILNMRQQGKKLPGNRKNTRCVFNGYKTSFEVAAKGLRSWGKNHL